MTFLSSSKNHQPLARGAVKSWLLLSFLKLERTFCSKRSIGGEWARRAGASDLEG